MSRVLYLIAELTKHGVSVSISGDKLKLSGTQAPPAGLLELFHKHKDALRAHLKDEGKVPRLPWQLERLIRATCQGEVKVNVPGVHDINRYTLAWVAEYLCGDRSEALNRLWEVHNVWQAEQ